MTNDQMARDENYFPDPVVNLIYVFWSTARSFGEKLLRVFADQFFIIYLKIEVRLIHILKLSVNYFEQIM